MQSGTAPASRRASPAPAGASENLLATYGSVGFALSATGYAVARRFRETLALEPREFTLLPAVAAAEGSSQQAIAGRLRIPASRMVSLLDALEASRLVERRLNPADRRTRALHLSEPGRELLEHAFALASGLERDLCAELSGAEREQLLGALARLAGRLGLVPGVHAALADA